MIGGLPAGDIARPSQRGTVQEADPGDQQYRAIFEATSEAMFISTADGRIVEANPAFTKMHGLEARFPIEAVTVSPELLGLLSSLGRRPARTTHTRADGTLFRVEVTCRTFQYQGEAAVLGIVRDITDQVRMEEVLEGRVAERTRELESLLGVARAVTSTLELRELVRLVLTELGSVVDYSAASLILVEGEELVVHDLVVDPRRAGKDMPQTGARFSIAQLTNPARKAAEHPATLDYPCVQVAASQAFWEDISQSRPVIIDDVLTSDGAIAVSYREAMGHLLYTDAFAFIRTWMAVPLIVKGKILGYFGIANDSPGCFNEKMIALAKAFADQVSVAIENARLYEQARTLAALQERQRLARDLHDSVAQAMYGVALGARTARKYLEKDIEAIEPVDYVVSLAAAGLAEMRALIFDLHPGAIAEEGLVNAVKRQVTAVEARHGISVYWNAVEPEVELPVKEAVYSIIREALHNVVKHAQATAVAIRLETSDSHLEFSVQDDGIGFDGRESTPGHLGLKSMRERVEDLGGSIVFDTASGRGTKVVGSVPI